MSGSGIKGKKAGIDRLLGIRARLALLALILVAPLMLQQADCAGLFRILADRATKRR
jgi:hypothetical protein